MKNLILICMVLAVSVAPSRAKAEVINYRCNNGDSEFQIDTSASKVTLKSYGYFGNFIITSPVLLTSTSAQWQMKNRLDASCSYTANASFYKITDPITVSTQCSSGKGAQVIFTGTCPDGSGSQTFYCCAR
ncbi:MAG: hypothetical protein OEL57_06920 [Trichlorobacter sp.]|uniref:hypothetical protein n=1 Tax=Trichlorobacter sp. TaxID=2911007 RepID=UPI002564A8A2|nr:hypothetical protein [Trichlorobacter sp.]MDK9717628.1 hypothetical protein [Trichlorobacter sp.]